MPKSRLDLLCIGDELSRCLRDKRWRIATAESCTGGAIASALTDLPGSSEIFDRAWVTYSNEAKVQELGVPATHIEREGAVSGVVAAAMARGARERANTDIAISVSGIAGPGGGSQQKPVGLVYLAVATANGGVVVKAQFLALERLAFKRTVTALALLSALRVAQGDTASLGAFHGVQWTRPLEEFPA